MRPAGTVRAEPIDAAPRRAVTVTVAVCGVAAVAAVLLASLFGQALAGVALALGLLLGAGNGVMARSLLTLGGAFAATSLARLIALSGVAVACGVFLGFNRVVLVLVGLAAAQLVLSAASAREVLRRR
ncbi:MAG: hypothetical protein WCB85_06255 [Candidatus Dormiibacterota bacterium]